MTRPRSSRISSTSARPLERGARVMWPAEDSRCITDMPCESPSAGVARPALWDARFKRGPGGYPCRHEEKATQARASRSCREPQTAGAGAPPTRHAHAGDRDRRSLTRNRPRVRPPGRSHRDSRPDRSLRSREVAATPDSRCLAAAGPTAPFPRVRGRGPVPGGPGGSPRGRTSCRSPCTDRRWAP